MDSDSLWSFGMPPAENENEAHVRYRQACAAIDNQDLEGALDHLQIAVKLASSSSARSVYITLQGGVLRRLGRFDDARLVLKEAVTEVPTNAYAWRELGLCNFKLEEYTEAASCFEQAIALSPDYRTYTMLANAELAFDPKSALFHAEKALELAPEWDEAIKVLHAARRLIS